MAFFVLIALIAVAIIYISIAKKKKIAIAISLMVIGVYHLYVSHTCGPNRADVKVMKPMAEKISDYIVKNGIPESLKEIPDLPYGLVGCEREIKKLKGKNDSGHYGIYLIETNEVCMIPKKNIYIKYSYGYYPMEKESSIVIRFEDKITETDAFMDMEKKNGENFIIDSPLKFASGKTDGICNPMKQ